MAKKLLKWFFIPMLLTFFGAGGALAATNDKSFSSFDVREILSVDDSDNGDENLTQDLITEANERGISPITAFVLLIINILSLLVGSFAFVMILIGGIIWITSGGSQTAIDRGKSILLSSIVGLAIAMLAYFIPVFVESFFF